MRRVISPTLLVALLAAGPLSACDYYAAPRYAPVRDSLAVRAPIDEAPYVWVLGRVGLPGRYRMIAPATLTLVLRDAGGIGPRAWHTVILSRREAGRWVRRAYDVDAIWAGEIDDVDVYAGDVIDVVARTD